MLVVIQIKDLRKTVQNQTYQAVYSEMLNPDDEKQEAQAHIVAELICDLFDDVYHQGSTMSPKTFKEWTSYMHGLFVTYVSVVTNPTTL